MQDEKRVAENSVLIVDDAGIVRLACQRVLTKAGYNVRTAENGREALEKMQDEPVSVVLLDLKMPLVNGLELMRPLRDLWPETEVVIMTAYTDNAMVDECRKLGAMAMVIKPFGDIKSLVSIVGKAMVRSRLRQGLAIESEKLLRQVLVSQEWVSPFDFEQALHISEHENLKLSQALVKQGAITWQDMEWAAARFLDIPCVHVDEQMIDRNLLREMPLLIAKKNKCLPLFKEDGAFHVVAADPVNDRIKNELEDLLDTPVTMYKGRLIEIEEAIEKLEKNENMELEPGEVAGRLESAGPREKAAMLSALLERQELVSVQEASIKMLGEGYCLLEIKGELKARDGNRESGEQTDPRLSGATRQSVTDKSPEIECQRGDRDGERKEDGFRG